ncbi:MAG: hypothetical protein K9L96_05545, partial [Candidatus Omnitrophica bacterium]|nr:hypothetical protein [Candidatus Omnitrophota bacterium]
MRNKTVSSYCLKNMKNLPVNKEIITYLLLTFCSLFVLFSYLDLNPQIGRNLFFSSSDPQLQQ